MKAVILNNGGKFNPNHRKETHFNSAYVVVCVVKGRQIRCPVELRFYSTQSRTYACIWVQGNMVSKSGSGYAGGYGYHRESAAAGEAIENAGIQLSERIHGVGNEAIRQAVLAIAREVYPDAEGLSVIDVHP